MFNNYGDLFYIYSFGCFFTITASVLSYIVINSGKLKYYKNIEYYIFFFSIIFYLTSVILLSFKKIDALNYYADHATHLEIMWRYNNGLGLTSLLSESYHSNSHWFSAHFTPIIFITYAPIFYLFPYSETLFVLETIFISSSIIPLYLICKLYFDKKQSLLFCSCFFFYPTIFYTNLYGPAYIELAIPFFLWIFYFLDSKHLKLFWISLTLALLIREEVSLIIASLGLYIYFIRREKFGLIIFFIGAAYFLMVINYIIPSFSGNNKLVATSIYSSWGENPSEIVKNIILNPIETIYKMLSITRVGNLIIFLIPLLFTPLFSFFTFMIALPNLVLTFFSDSISNYSFILYYLSPSIPVLFYASIKSIKSLSEAIHINKNALISSLFVASLCSSIFFGATPISLQFWNENYKVGNFSTTNFYLSEYIQEQNDIDVKKIVSLIPENAAISAEQHILPLLYKKEKMLVFPSIENDINYVLIDKNKKEKAGWDDTYLSFRNDPQFFYNEFIESNEWNLEIENNGVMLFKRNRKND